MSTATVFSQPVGTIINTSGNSGVTPLSVGNYTELSVDINIATRTGTPTIQFFIDRIGADGVAYNVWSSSVISTTGPISQSIGAGLALNASFGNQIQFRWTFSGSTSYALSSSIIGK